MKSGGRAARGRARIALSALQKDLWSGHSWAEHSVEQNLRACGRERGLVGLGRAAWGGGAERGRRGGWRQEGEEGSAN